MPEIADAWRILDTLLPHLEMKEQRLRDGKTDWRWRYVKSALEAIKAAS